MCISVSSGSNSRQFILFFFTSLLLLRRNRMANCLHAHLLATTQHTLVPNSAYVISLLPFFYLLTFLCLLDVDATNCEFFFIIVIIENKLIINFCLAMGRHAFRCGNSLSSMPHASCIYYKLGTQLISYGWLTWMVFSYQHRIFLPFGDFPICRCINHADR